MEMNKRKYDQMNLGIDLLTRTRIDPSHGSKSIILS